MFKYLLPLSLSTLFAFCTGAQPLNNKKSFTRQDTLRGSIGPERAWWDVQHYEITVQPDIASKSIRRKTTIRYKVLPGQTTDYMQIDLLQPMIIDSIFYNGKLYINYPGMHY